MPLILPVQSIEPNTTKDKPWLTLKSSHGDTRNVYKLKDSSNEERVYIKKTEDEFDEYINHLASNIEASLKETFKASFKAKRLAMIDLEGLFFYHYAQVVSSIKAQAQAQNIVLSTDIDELFKEFAKKTSQETNEKFKKLVQKSMKKDGSINVEKLNESINQEIKKLKKTFDAKLKQKLDEQNIPIASKHFRKITNAFNAPVCMKKQAPQLNEQIDSTTTTAHDKAHGPSVNLITFSKGDNIVYQGYRTSHLVSNPVRSAVTEYTTAAMIVTGVLGGLILAGCFVVCPPLGFALVGFAALCLGIIAYDATQNKKLKEKEDENINKTKEIIDKFMQNRLDPNLPMVYNLFTSTHAGIGTDIITGFFDYKDNQQTQRLRTLTDAQFAYNADKVDIKDMFFTLNTPTNTYGKEISLSRFPSALYPHMHKVAQSNLIALALLLVEIDNTHLKEMVEAYKSSNSGNFQKAYEALKKEINIPPITEDSENQQAKEFLKARFLTDSAAHHTYAKMSALCVGILAKDKVNIIAGCKSGNERTGGILGRIATYFSLTEDEKKTPNIFSSNTNSKNLGYTSLMLVTGVVGSLILIGCIAACPPLGFFLVGIAALCLLKIAKNLMYSEEPSFIDKKFNDTRCNSTSVTGVSRIDQGSDPKTQKQTGWFLWLLPNTNQTEKWFMSNIITWAMSSMQAHKDPFHLKSSTVEYRERVKSTHTPTNQNDIATLNEENPLLTEQHNLD